MPRRTRPMIPIALLLLALPALLAQEAEREKGVAPGALGTTEAGVPFEEPRGQTLEVPEAPRLAVERFDVRRLAEGTALGEPGDLLVTFFGSGFLLTAHTPRLRIGEELVLETTEIDREGTRLFVVLDAEARDAVVRAGPTEVVVENPGHWKEGQGSARLEVDPERLLRPAEDASPVRIVYRDGAFERVDAQER